MGRGQDDPVTAFGTAAAVVGGTTLNGLNASIVGVAGTPDADGYWLVAADGGVFNYGDAPFMGSLGNIRLNEPIVAMSSSATGHGYRIVASDGGVFAFGDATFAGSLGNLSLNAPITAMAATGDGNGYWLLGAYGGVFCFGDAPFEGSDGSSATTAPAVGIVGRPGGYWVAYGTTPGAQMVQQIAAFVAGRSDNVTVAVEDRLTGQIFQFRPGVVEHTASTLKVDILATLLTQAQAEGRGLTAEEQSLAVPMIEDSLDSPADSLWTTLGPGDVSAFERDIGMTATVPATDGVWGTTTTALDRLAMVRALVSPVQY